MQSPLREQPINTPPSVLEERGKLLRITINPPVTCASSAQASAVKMTADGLDDVVRLLECGAEDARSRRLLADSRPRCCRSVVRVRRNFRCRRRGTCSPLSCSPRLGSRTFIVKVGDTWPLCVSTNGERANSGDFEAEGWRMAGGLKAQSKTGLNLAR